MKQRRVRFFCGYDEQGEEQEESDNDDFDCVHNNRITFTQLV